MSVDEIFERYFIEVKSNKTDYSYLFEEFSELRKLESLKSVYYKIDEYNQLIIQSKRYWDDIFIEEDFVREDYTESKYYYDAGFIDYFLSLSEEYSNQENTYSNTPEIFEIFKELNIEMIENNNIDGDI